MSKLVDQAHTVKARYDQGEALAIDFADQLKKAGKLKVSDEAKINQLKTKTKKGA